MIKGDYDLSSDQTNRVMKGVKDELFAAEQASINMVLPAYSDEEKQEFVDKLKNTFPNEIIFYFAAAMADKIPMKMMENALKDVEEAKASIPEREPFKKIRLVTHYSQSKSVRDEWIKEDTGEWAIIKKRWDNMNGDYIIAYEEMPLTVKDTK
jgi:hypothetical protein